MRCERLSILFPLKFILANESLDYANSLSQGGRLFKKRESTISEGTTTTLVVCHVPQNNAGSGASATSGGKGYPPFRSPLLPPGDVG